MASNSIKRDHHLWTRDTIKNVSGHVTLDIDGDIVLDADGGEIFLKDGGTMFGEFSTAGAYSELILYENGGASEDDYLRFRCGADGESSINTKDTAGADAHLTISADGNLLFSAIGHTEFNGTGVGFRIKTPTYDATSTVVDFKTGNKQFVTFDGGNITNLQLHFPAVSGNFVVLLKQDGSGSRTITNYKVYDSGGLSASGSAVAKFAGLAVGANPTLTTTANYVDILSFFWDSENEFAYGVASLDFRF